jgi:hypothetical protein
LPLDDGEALDLWVFDDGLDVDTQCAACSITVFLKPASTQALVRVGWAAVA